MAQVSHVTMIRVLGAPAVERDGLRLPPPRGRKTWALLAYLLLSERPQPRSRVASLLFPGAEDPLGALRWALADLRRALGGAAEAAGDPLELRLRPGVRVDVRDSGTPDGELLEGMSFPSSPVLDAWLGVMRRSLDGAARALAHDDAVARLAARDLDGAMRLATELVARDPLDHQAQELLIRCLARSGRQADAERQLAACEALLGQELGITPGPELRLAARERGADPRIAAGDREAAPAQLEAGGGAPGGRAGGAGVGSPRAPRAGAGDREAALAQLEAGEAALEAGAVEPGIEILRTACAEAAAAGDAALEARALATLGSALVHALRGRDEEGALRLHEALGVAEDVG